MFAALLVPTQTGTVAQFLATVCERTDVLSLRLAGMSPFFKVSNALPLSVN